MHQLIAVRLLLAASHVNLQARVPFISFWTTHIPFQHDTPLKSDWERVFLEKVCTQLLPIPPIDMLIRHRQAPVERKTDVGETLVAAHSRDPKVFDRDVQTKRSEARADLQLSTDLLTRIVMLIGSETCRLGGAAN